MKRTMKVMAVVLATLLMVSAMSFTVFADPALYIGAVTYVEDGDDFVFTIPYEATEEVEQVSILATVGGATAPAPTVENIVYVNQEAKDFDGFTFKVAKEKFSADADTIYVRLGGTKITSAQEADALEVEIAQASEGFKVYGYTVAGATVAIDAENSAVADAEGYFEITDIAAGEYTLTITAKAAIGREITITVGAADYEVSNSETSVSLIIGDISGDSAIDNTDLNSLKAVFGEADEACDINSDALVDNSDLNQIKSAFGMTAADYE